MTAEAQAVIPKKRGRPPAHPRLTLKDSETIMAIAEAAVGLRSKLDLTLDLEASEQEIAQFLKRNPTKKAVREKVRELRQSGTAARRAANSALSAHAVPAMTEIVRDREMHPGSRIGAAGTLSKIAGAGGDREKEIGPKYSITINLGGEEHPEQNLHIETAVSGDVVDE